MGEIERQYGKDYCLNKGSIASETFEAFTLKGSGRPKYINFWNGKHDFGLSRTSEYLGVTFDMYETSGIDVAVENAEKQ